MQSRGWPTHRIRRHGRFLRVGPGTTVVVADSSFAPTSSGAHPVRETMPNANAPIAITAAITIQTLNPDESLPVVPSFLGR